MQIKGINLIYYIYTYIYNFISAPDYFIFLPFPLPHLPPPPYLLFLFPFYFYFFLVFFSRFSYIIWTKSNGKRNDFSTRFISRRRNVVEITWGYLKEKKENSKGEHIQSVSMRMGFSCIFITRNTSTQIKQKIVFLYCTLHSEVTTRLFRPSGKFTKRIHARKILWMMDGHRSIVYYFLKSLKMYRKRPDTTIAFREEICYRKKIIIIIKRNKKVKKSLISRKIGERGSSCASRDRRA